MLSKEISDVLHPNQVERVFLYCTLLQELLSSYGLSKNTLSLKTWWKRLQFIIRLFDLPTEQLLNYWECPLVQLHAASERMRKENEPYVLHGHFLALLKWRSKFQNDACAKDFLKSH